MNSRWKLMITGCALVAASVSYAFHARAGAVATENVTVSISEMFFEGFIGATRFSSDRISYISCGNTVSNQGTVGTCSARDVNHNKTATCSTKNPAMINVINGINSISKVYVAYNSNGTCTTIEVTQSSQHLFK